jgi:hypothetical protein
MRCSRLRCRIAGVEDGAAVDVGGTVGPGGPVAVRGGWGRQ